MNKIKKHNVALFVLLTAFGTFYLWYWNDPLERVMRSNVIELYEAWSYGENPDHYLAQLSSGELKKERAITRDNLVARGIDPTESLRSALKRADWIEKLETRVSGDFRDSEKLVVLTIWYTNSEDGEATPSAYELYFALEFSLFKTTIRRTNKIYGFLYKKMRKGEELDQKGPHPLRIVEQIFRPVFVHNIKE